MAHTLQKPEELPSVAVVLMGRQGTGKGVFVNEFGKIFGDHFKQVSSSEQLLGRFNALLADSLLIFMDEALWGGEKKLEGVLKTLITESRRTIEFKHKDMVTMNNYNRLIMATNNDWAIPAGAEERRYFVLAVSDQRMQDTAYFQTITDQMNNGGRAALLKTLLERDISKTNIRIAPKTRALLQQKEETFSSVEDWLYGKLKEGRILEGHDCWVAEIDKQTLYRNFQEQMDDKHTRDNAFHRRLKRLLPGAREERPTNQFGHRTRVLKLPPLEECRSHFEAHLNQKVDWEEY
ncbi:primase-helicase family protein [Endozoicomonas sp. ONNA2]|uniref:primase-helicase family protein n=1 Tax=Endozoicomonas sp. ONNA2 TaxID=2828741 RepID=UPI00214884D9|nr:primase-helicase family protein [Endozoicomonas sp. ONNA2]